MMNELIEMKTTMTELRAKPVVKDKFWIVEDGDRKVATIQAIEEGGFVYVHEDTREKFPTVNLLKKKLNISFEKSVKKSKPSITHEVYGYACGTRPYNELWDVSKKIPIYTKTDKSKSYFCAGYYLIKFSNNWVKAYCPKLITLQRYEFLGPFKTADEQHVKLRIANGN
jgi:hypothetical protein